MKIGFYRDELVRVREVTTCDTSWHMAIIDRALLNGNIASYGVPRVDVFMEGDIVTSTFGRMTGTVVGFEPENKRIVVRTESTSTQDRTRYAYESKHLRIILPVMPEEPDEELEPFDTYAVTWNDGTKAEVIYTPSQLIIINNPKTKLHSVYSLTEPLSHKGLRKLLGCSKVQKTTNRVSYY